MPPACARAPRARRCAFRTREAAPPGCVSTAARRRRCRSTPVRRSAPRRRSGACWCGAAVAELSSVVASGAGPGVDVTCEASAARLELDNVTVIGSGDPGVRGDCATSGRTVTIAVDQSIVWGFSRAFATGASTTVSTGYSDYPGATGETNMAVNPLFTGAGESRLRADSPLVDAGRIGPLSDSEPHEDALGFVRVVDGNGDGAPRRDIGAHECSRRPRRRPPATCSPTRGRSSAPPPTTTAPAPPRRAGRAPARSPRCATGRSSAPSRSPRGASPTRFPQATPSSRAGPARTAPPPRSPTCATPLPRSTSARAR